MPARADLVEEVLSELYILAGTETPSAEDDAKVDKAIDNAMGELAELHLAYWPITDIPYAVMRGLGLVVQGHCARKFIPQMTVAECEDIRKAGIVLIREVTAMQPDNDTVAKHYF